MNDQSASIGQKGTCAGFVKRSDDRPDKRLVSLLALLLVTVPEAGTAQNPGPDPAEHAMFRAGPAHTGSYSPAGRTLSGLSWVFEAGGDLIASPSVAGGVVYLATGGGMLHAIDLTTGRELWRRALGSPSHSTPAVAGRLVYAVTRDGRIQAIDRETGRRIWEVATGRDAPLAWGHESGDMYTSSPAVTDGLVVVGAGDGHVYALDAATGMERWRFATGGRIRSSPALADGRVHVGSFDGVVYALALETGEAVWRFETAGAGLFSGDFGFDRRSIQSSPAVVDGVVYVGSRDGNMYALDATNGRPRFTVSHGTSWVITSPAVAHGTVFLGSSDAAFAQAVDARTGAEHWRTRTPGIVWPSPAVAGDVVIVATVAGIVRGLDRSTGDRVWEFRTRGDLRSSPVVADGLVLIGDTDGMLYAWRTDTGPPVHRAVFHDSTLARASWNGDAGQWTRMLVNRGYQELDAPGIVEFLTARIADRAPSVVVFALNHLPHPLTGRGAEDALLRTYLEAGGKVVWPGVPPLIWPRDPRTGRVGAYGDIDWSAPGRLLGVDHQLAIFDDRGIVATAEGRRWGMPRAGRLAWGVSPDEVTTVLAHDEWGFAAAWVRHYGGAPGTGFVRLSDDDVITAYLIAEHRPGGQ